ASGTALQYQWVFNGTNLPGATNATLVLTNIQSNQAGTYAVNVSNLVGQLASTGATVTVLGPVQIISQPQSQTVIISNSATFSVSVSGTPPFTYQWRFNGAPMPNQNNSTLQIASAQPSDAGEYRVQVQNSAGVAMSDPAILTVLVPPSIT